MARSVYDEFADEYAADIEGNAWNALYERPATIALLPPVAGKDVLDAGCGSGPLSAWLVEHGARVTGFDASPKMVEIAKRRGLPSASFVVADLASPLEFLADDSFDVVVAGLVLHYLEDWVAPLRELRRVLRDTGTLVFSTHHPTSDMELSVSGDYFATELLHDQWTKGDKTFDRIGMRPHLPLGPGRLRRVVRPGVVHGRHEAARLRAVENVRNPEQKRHGDRQGQPEELA